MQLPNSMRDNMVDDLDEYLKHGSQLGCYSVEEGNEIKYNNPGLQYDTVVVKDCSQCPIQHELKKLFNEYEVKDAEIARM